MTTGRHSPSAFYAPLHGFSVAIHKSEPLPPPSFVPGARRSRSTNLAKVAPNLQEGPHAGHSHGVELGYSHGGLNYCMGTCVQDGPWESH